MRTGLREGHRVKVNGEMSKEGEVFSVVPQRTVFCPCLFMIFIDNADVCAVGETLIIKFAHDIKGLRTVERDEDTPELQATLNKLSGPQLEACASMMINAKSCILDTTTSSGNTRWENKL